jgi:hypothetical protein
LQGADDGRGDGQGEAALLEFLLALAAAGFSRFCDADALACDGDVAARADDVAADDAYVVAGADAAADLQVYAAVERCGYVDVGAAQVQVVAGGATK